MRTAVDIETAITTRCITLALTRHQAQALADAPPFPSDLVQVLGLNPDTFAPLSPKPWLSMAAKTSSVSYRGVLSPETLQAVLVNANVPAELNAHVTYFLNEAPMQLVVMAIEQASQLSGTPIANIWSRVANLSKMLQCRRFRTLGESPTTAQIK